MKTTLLILLLIGLTESSAKETEAEHRTHVIEHEDASHDRFVKRIEDGYPAPERDARMFYMRNFQFQTVYDVLSFSLASMMATTVFLFMRVPSVTERYKTALIISGLVTFIAAYHYPSDSDMTHFLEHEVITTETRSHVVVPMHGMHGFKPPYHIHHHAIPGQTGPPTLTGVPFNDAYRYMDWLLTVPLLLMEIVLVMNLPKEESNSKCWVLGVGSALMIVSGYQGELVVQGDLTV